MQFSQLTMNPVSALRRLKGLGRLLYRGFRGEVRIALHAQGVVAQSGIDRWYEGVPSERPYARYSMLHVLEKVPRSGLVIESGSGLGQMVMVLAAYGFKQVVGLEYDRQVHEGALKLSRLTRFPCTLLNRDCLLRESFAAFGEVDCYLALNWTYQHAEGLPLSVSIASSILRPGGLFIVDMIPDTCRLQYCTQDMTRSADRRRPSEYRYRWSKDAVEGALESGGFEIVERAFFDPRWVHVCRKT